MKLTIIMIMIRMRSVSVRELCAMLGAARCRDGTVVKVMTMVIMVVEKMIVMIIIIIVKMIMTMIIMVFKIIMVILKMMIIQARDGFSHYLDHLF